MTPAPLVFALALPQSLAGALVFILVVLAATYVLLRALISVQPVPHPPEQEDDDDEWPQARSEDSTQDERAEPVSFPSASVVQDGPNADVSVDAMTIRGVRIAVGDAAVTVMQVVRRHESTAMPVIDKNDAGRATYIERKYKVDGTPVTFAFERNSESGRMVLTHIYLHNA